MEISLKDAVMNRHSVRGFLSKQVPEATLKEVFELAQWSPSGTNQQPWQVYVASGQTMENLRNEFIRRSKEKVIIPGNASSKRALILKRPPNSKLECVEELDAGYPIPRNPGQII